MVVIALTFIPDLKTTWNITVTDPELDNAINLIESDPILSICGDDVLSQLQLAKTELEGVNDELADIAGDLQQSYQEQYIEMNASIDTGLMHDTIEVENEGNGSRSVGPTAYSLEGFPYPMCIENGSKDHWVAPKTAKALHWITDSGEHAFSKGHMVSGVKARPFVEPSQSSTMEDLERIVFDELDKIFG